ncbi:MAG: methyl-accepting chemotaxis protein [Bacillota bacterium]
MLKQQELSVEEEKATHLSVVLCFWSMTGMLFLTVVFAMLHALDSDPRRILISAFAGLAFSVFLNLAYLQKWYADIYRYLGVGLLILLCAIINITVDSDISMQLLWFMPVTISCLYFETRLYLGAIGLSIVAAGIIHAFGFAPDDAGSSPGVSMAVFLLIGMFITVILYHFISKTTRIFHTLIAAQKKQKTLAEESDSSARKSQEAAKALMLLIGQLRKSVSEVNQVISKLSRNTAEINTDVSTIVKDTGATEGITSQLAAGAEEVASAAQIASRLLSETAQEARKGEEIVQKSMAQIENLQKQWENTTKIIENLHDKSYQIEKVTALLGIITRQTNLLAINAAIEASRAGETGKGIGVVAEEVRALATESNKATTQITEIIDEMRGMITTIVEQGQAFVENLNAQVKISRDAQSALVRIREGSMENVSTIEEISSATEEQAASSSGIAEYVEKIFTNMNKIYEAVQSTAAAGEQSMAVMAEILKGSDALVKMASDLQRTLRTS